MKNIILTLIAAIAINGCVGENKAEEFNKPAMYWYQKIVDAVAVSGLDKADEYYISLKSEHTNSPLLPTATLILADAHMHQEEYLLAGFYFDEFAKRFADDKDLTYVEYMKLKASFLGIQDIYKDQKLILDTMQRAKQYRMRYPDSKYTPLVTTMEVRMAMALYLLNENIANLYARIGKPKAAKIYRMKNQTSFVHKADIIPPKRGIIAKIFD